MHIGHPVLVNIPACITLCGQQSRDTTEMYPGKFMHIIDAQTFDPNVLLTMKPLMFNFNPQCNVTVVYQVL